MHHALVMRGDKSIHQLCAKGNDLSFRQGSCGNNDVYCRSGNIFRNQKASFILFVEVKNGSDVGMVQLGENKCFFAEPPSYGCI